MLRQLGVLPVEFPKVGQFSPDSQAGKGKVDKVSVEDKEVTEETMFQPQGQCDPESHLPCQCPMRTVVEVPASSRWLLYLKIGRTWRIGY